MVNSEMWQTKENYTGIYVYHGRDPVGYKQLNLFGEGFVVQTLINK